MWAKAEAEAENGARLSTVSNQGDREKTLWRSQGGRLGSPRPLSQDEEGG